MVFIDALFAPMSVPLCLCTTTLYFVPLSLPPFIILKVRKEKYNMAKKKKASVFDLQPGLNKASEVTKIPPPVTITIGIIVGWLFWRLTSILQTCNEKGIEIIEGLQPQNLFYNSQFPPSIDKNSVLIGLVCGVIACLMVIVSNDKKKKTRRGAEHGSAKWFPKEASLAFRDPEFFYNTIFSENEMFSINDGISQRNRNVLMLGSPGTGKSRFVYKPSAT